MTDTPAAPAPERVRFGAAHILVTVVLGLIAAWFLWDGIGNLVNLPVLFEQLGLTDETPWLVLWLGVLHPVVFFVLAVLTARRLAVGGFALVLIGTLGAIAAVRLSLIAVATGTISVLPV